MHLPILTPRENSAIAMNQVVFRFGKFAFVGGCATAVHYTILTFLVEILELAPVLATTIGFTVAAAVNYSFNRRFTFESRARHVVALPKFLTVALLGAAMNAGVVDWFEGHTSLHYLVSQICATIVVLAWNFSANAIWTFKQAQ
jgi:putative flippase GtrA